MLCSQLNFSVSCAGLFLGCVLPVVVCSVAVKVFRFDVHFCELLGNIFFVRFSIEWFQRKSIEPAAEIYVGGDDNATVE